MKFRKKIFLDETDEESNSGVDDEDDCDNIDNSTSKSGVRVCASVNTLDSGVGKGPIINEDAGEDKVEVPWDSNLDFGEVLYWSNGTIVTDVESYMFSAIVKFSNMDGLWSIPQYGFNRGISKFKQEGYDATVSELSNNLIGKNAVNMQDKK